MAIKQSPGLQLGAALARLTLGKAGKKPVSGTPSVPGTLTSPAPASSGMPPIPSPPPTGQTVQAALPGITAQATKEETARLASEQEQTDRANRLAQTATGTVGQADLGFQQAQTAAQVGHQTNQALLQDAQAALQKLPEQVQGTVDAAKNDFAAFAQKGLSEVTARADETISKVAEGQGAALQAATQGIQGNVRNQINAISGDPNIPPAQKAQMITQVKMQGAMALAPAVGQTILQFNTLQAETAVNMNKQVTDTINQATATYGGLATAGMQQVAGAFEASKQIGATLAGIAVNDNSTYAMNKAAITAQRFQADSVGDQFQLALLPDRATPVPQYSQIMAGDLQARVNAMQADFQNLAYTYGMSIDEIMRQQGEWNSKINSLGSVVGMLPGAAGVIGTAAVGLFGAFSQPQIQPPTFAGPAGGYGGGYGGYK